MKYFQLARETSLWGGDGFKFNPLLKARLQYWKAQGYAADNVINTL